jgi:RES domain-containing protein
LRHQNSPPFQALATTPFAAAAFLDRQGILVPSVHHEGSLNLVVFTDRLVAAGESELEVEESIDIA